MASESSELPCWSRTKRGMADGALGLRDGGSFGHESVTALFDSATPCPTLSTVVYVRPGQPRRGIAQLFSATMIGERS